MHTKKHKYTDIRRASTPDLVAPRELPNVKGRRGGYCFDNRHPKLDLHGKLMTYYLLSCYSLITLTTLLHVETERSWRLRAMTTFSESWPPVRSFRKIIAGTEVRRSVWPAWRGCAASRPDPRFLVGPRLRNAALGCVAAAARLLPIRLLLCGLPFRDNILRAR